MSATDLGINEVLGVSRIEGPLVFVEGIGSVGYDEVVEIIDSRGRLRLGRVLEVGEELAVIEVFAGTSGLSIDGTRIHFMGTPYHIPVAEDWESTTKGCPDAHAPSRA